MLVSYTNHLAKTMPSSPADNAIMTIGEVADFIKITERTIYRLAGAKQIPAFKVGGSWRFSKVDLIGGSSSNQPARFKKTATEMNKPTCLVMADSRSKLRSDIQNQAFKRQEGMWWLKVGSDI